MNNTRRKEIAAAVRDLHALTDAVTELAGKLSDIKDAVEQAKDDEQEYYDNMPENMQNGDKGETAAAAVSALEDAVSKLDDVLTALEGSDIEDAISSLEEASE